MGKGELWRQLNNLMANLLDESNAPPGSALRHSFNAALDKVESIEDPNLKSAAQYIEIFKIGIDDLIQSRAEGGLGEMKRILRWWKN